MIGALMVIWPIVLGMAYSPVLWNRFPYIVHGAIIPQRRLNVNRVFLRPKVPEMEFSTRKLGFRGFRVRNPVFEVFDVENSSERIFQNCFENITFE